MAFLGTAGDTTEVQEEEMNQKRGGSLLEAGWYRVALVEDEAKPYGWGTGLNMQFQILTGDYADRRLFDFLCIEHHKSEKAQHIARVKLREFATAAGHRSPEIEDTTPLYNKPVMVEVYRAKEEEEKYADEDGRKARIGQFLSVDAWKLSHAGEHMPGVAKKKAALAVAKAPIPNSSPAPYQADDDEIPF